jgi:predicted glutamine amidotransferase
MCQLLGMNCNVATDICFSFSGFQARGGLTDVHKDGWGIAFFEGKGVRQFLDSQASAHSPIAELVRNYPIKSKNVIAHIRKATQGTVALENTHPFSRELWGHYWIFAHNGNLIGFEPSLNGTFSPVGQTDSERVFCWILQELKTRFGDEYPGAQKVYDAIHELTLKAGAFGEFNFLFSNGEMLIAHCSTQLCYIVRKAPFAQASLKDREVTVDFSSVTTQDDRVAVIATVPLTDNENWNILEPGHLCFFKDGSLNEKRKTAPGRKNTCTS